MMFFAAFDSISVIWQHLTLFMSFPGLTVIRLGSEVSCLRTLPEKTRESSVAQTQDLCITSKTPNHFAMQDTVSLATAK